METSPAAKSASDHPSRVQSIDKMAPQSPCSDNKRTTIPGTAAGERDGSNNWADATCTPWSRPSRAPSPRPSSSTTGSSSSPPRTSRRRTSSWSTRCQSRPPCTSPGPVSSVAAAAPRSRTGRNCHEMVLRSAAKKPTDVSSKPRPSAAGSHHHGSTASRQSEEKAPRQINSDKIIVNLCNFV